MNLVERHRRVMFYVRLVFGALVVLLALGLVVASRTVSGAAEASFHELFLTVIVTGTDVYPYLILLDLVVQGVVLVAGWRQATAAEKGVAALQTLLADALLLVLGYVCLSFVVRLG